MVRLSLTRGWENCIIKIKIVNRESCGSWKASMSVMARVREGDLAHLHTQIYLLGLNDETGRHRRNNGKGKQLRNQPIRGNHLKNKHIHPPA